MTHPIERETLFLAHLSKHDFEKFDEHPFPYSASTGAGAVEHPEWYPNMGAYVATYMSELLTAIRVLGWTTFHFKRHGRAWVATHQVPANCQVS